MIRRLHLLPLIFLMGAVYSWAVPRDEYTRLARLSYIEGNVSYQHTADVDWSAASVNLPLEPGDRIYTGSDGRAEIEFDDGSVYRLARSTDIEILSLREELIQIRVLVGLSTVMVASDTDFEINTPAAAFTALQKGIYRFGVDESGNSDAIVRKGELEAANDQFSRRIKTGEMVQVSLSDPGKAEYASYSKRDEWDEWNDRRNADMRAGVYRRYLPDNVYIGVYDLNRHGRWINVESYGQAWVPYGISISWAPYSTGRWCYRPFYGWTWVSYEPWGWLPYHYGRWYRSSRYGWCWLPGPSFAFNFWSPALVTFYSGPGWISWCPLGPGDYYNINRYYYNRRVYGNHLAQLRGLHTRAPGNIFHRGDRNAFMIADVDGFRNGSFRERSRTAKLRSVDQPWRQGELVQDRLQIQPTKASFKPAPDRRASGPERDARSLPAVVRNSPSENLRGQAQFRRISNPAVPPLKPRAERRSVEQQQRQEQGVGSRPDARVVDAQLRDRPSSGIAGLQRTESVDSGGRRTPSYRYADTKASDREGTEPGKGAVAEPRSKTGIETRQPNTSGVERRLTEQPRRSEQDVESGTNRRAVVETQQREHSIAGSPGLQRTESVDSSGRKTTTYRYSGTREIISEGTRPGRDPDAEPRTRVRSEDPVREERKAQPPPSRVTPRIEEYHRPNNGAAQRSVVVEPSNTGNAPTGEARRTEGYRKFSSPQPASNPPGNAPRMEQSPRRAAPRSPAPSIERDSGPRISSTPSRSRSGGDMGASPARKSEEMRSSSPSGAREARGRDRR